MVLTEQDVQWRLNVARDRMAAVGAPPLATEMFLHNYRRLLAGEQALIPESEIIPLDALPRMEELAGYEQRGRAELAKLVIVKLAGGLGTSMGLEVPKAILPVKEGRTFLDITLAQVMFLRRSTGEPLPLLLMSSFATHAELERYLDRNQAQFSNPHELPVLFSQNRVPKIKADTLEPIRTDLDDPAGWCPPGHGDLYTVLWESGLLKRLIGRGYRYAFVSNIDNLGATVDVRLLGFMAESGTPFLMEAAGRTLADRKGGHLARRKDGRLLIRESVQCPPEDFTAFQDIQRHRFFNTNSLWLNLEALDRQMEKLRGRLVLPLIVNRKVINPRDPHSVPVFHLETAAGAAISLFEGAAAVEVPRSRFLPVKTTDDLLAIRSDIYLLDDDGTLMINPQRRLPTIVVDLDHRIYSDLREFDARFPGGAPSLLECASLAIEGDFLFEGGTRLRGEVFLRNRTPRQVLVPSGTVITGRMGSA